MRPVALVFAIPIIASLAALPCAAKTVVCVDGGNDKELSAYEGSLSGDITVPPDVVQAGGSLADCMAKLVKGDKLIIVAHGFADPGPPKSTGFIWQGVRYTGFGGGAGKYPVPAGFAGLNHVTVHVGSCYSSLDPDGTGGPQIPVTTSLQNAMHANANNTVTGFDGAAGNRTFVDIGSDQSDPNLIDQAKQYLADHQAEWQNNPPAGNKRNPRPANDQQKAAQTLVNDHFPNQKLPVTIRYTPVADNHKNPFDGQLAGTFTIAAVDTTPCSVTEVVYNSVLAPGPSRVALTVLVLALFLAAIPALKREVAAPGGSTGS